MGRALRSFALGAAGMEPAVSTIAMPASMGEAGAQRLSTATAAAA